MCFPYLKTILPGKTKHDIPTVTAQDGIVNDKPEVVDAMDNLFSFGEKMAGNFKHVGFKYSLESFLNSSDHLFKFVLVTEDQVVKVSHLWIKERNWFRWYQQSAFKTWC